MDLLRHVILFGLVEFFPAVYYFDMMFMLLVRVIFESLCSWIRKHDHMLR